MSNKVTCSDLFDNKVEVETGQLKFRPVAYGLILHEGKILLSNTKSTGRFSLPGGGVELGESLQQALKREAQEECGINIEIQKFVGFEERFFHYAPWKESWHVFAFLYICRPLSFELSDAGNVEDDESVEPRWVEISSLSVDQFQVFGERIMKILGGISA